jgi:hypothetical protein
VDPPPAAAGHRDGQQRDRDRAADAGLALLAEPGALWLRLAMLVGGVGLTGFATAAYIGAGLGPGPRDGLMTAWVRTRGGNVRTVRTTIQVAVTVAPPAGPQSAGAAANGGLATLPGSAGRPVPSRAPV